MNGEIRLNGAMSMENSTSIGEVDKEVTWLLFALLASVRAATGLGIQSQRIRAILTLGESMRVWGYDQ